MFDVRVGTKNKEQRTPLRPPQIPPLIILHFSLFISLCPAPFCASCAFCGYVLLIKFLKAVIVCSKDCQRHPQRDVTAYREASAVKTAVRLQMTENRG